MNPRTEKAIRAWLDLPARRRAGWVCTGSGTVELWDELSPYLPTAKFTLKSIIKKRYPAKKKTARRTK